MKISDRHKRTFNCLKPSVEHYRNIGNIISQHPSIIVLYAGSDRIFRLKTKNLNEPVTKMKMKQHWPAASRWRITLKYKTWRIGKI